MNSYIIDTTLLMQCPSTCFISQRAIFKEYDRYIHTARSTKYMQDVKSSLVSSVFLSHGCYIKIDIIARI